MVNERRIGVIGLGYVGLPVAVAFASRFPGTVGFDISVQRVAELRDHHDSTGEVDHETLLASGLEVSDDPEVLAGVDLFIVTVPTPIDCDRRPDLGPLRAATETVGRYLRPGGIVVYESTVYPGVTEEICGPLLAHVSGLRARRGLHARLLARAHQPGRSRAHVRADRQGRVGPGRRHARAVVADCYGQVVTRASIARRRSRSPRPPRSSRTPSATSTSRS